ncbi:MAG: YihY/virulence factor BrkB family protein [bacterium]
MDQHSTNLATDTATGATMTTAMQSVARPGAGGRAEKGAVSRLGRALGQLLGHEALPRMAAALSYRTIFALVPILLLAFLTLRLFRDTDSLLKNLLGRLMEQTGLANLASDATGQFNLQVWITQRVQEFSGINFTGIGLVSAGLLIYGAISLLVEVEGSFNVVYSAARGRAWARRILQYWMMLTLGPLAVFGSFMVGEQFSRVASSLASSTGGVVGLGVGPLLVGLVGYLTTVLISFVLVLALYLTLPNARVHLRPAMIGAAVAAVALEAGKAGFALYVKKAGYSSLYGSLALFPLFLMWVYITWLVVLFGLRLAYLIQFHKLQLLTDAWKGRLGWRAGEGDHSVAQLSAGRSGITDPSSAVAVLVAVADSFAVGKPAEVMGLAGKVQLAPEAVERVLGEMETAKLVNRVAVRAEGPADRWSLARPAEQITAAVALACGLRLADPPDGPKAARLFLAELRERQLEHAGRVPLTALLGTQAGKRAGVGLAEARPKVPPATAGAASATGPAG